MSFNSATNYTCTICPKLNAINNYELLIHFVFFIFLFFFFWYLDLFRLTKKYQTLPNNIEKKKKCTRTPNITYIIQLCVCLFLVLCVVVLVLLVVCCLYCNLWWCLSKWLLVCKSQTKFA